MARRSLMFTPGDRPEMLRKAPSAGADVIIFDLEDAVAPGRKAEAREVVNDVLADPDFDPDCEVCVRLNPAGIAADDDLRGVLGDGAADSLDAVMAPMTESPDDVETLARILAERGCRVPIFALVETATGILRAEEIARVSEVDALVFGAEDLAADIGATRTDEGTEVLHAREHVVLAASAAGVDALDTVFTDIEDIDGLADDAAFAVQLGYDGKMAIHPAQVSVINDAFTPAPERVEWAERVFEAKEDADAEGRGVFRVDGEMIDAPLIAQAERVLEYADAAGER
ncbi:HpcH/HpaI aldolase/citrate lyase family protein [Halorussus amylolyticus]|uniref:HpcH/HpaI aldolase/citrate lyase family protein n=1 Tax=Halorussus amylolyticus TaxID=1126242 RepID=UPI00104A5EB2|nr:CoA ester lyase [Halorussus amylolyticus]